MATKTAIEPTREENFAQWYQEVIKTADLAEHSVVRGCMIIKPRGYALWEAIQKALDKMIKDTGHQNVYFPLFIPLSFLEKEAAHVEGFAKECAVVTHYRLETDAQGKLIPSPNAQLQEPLIVRPTSETIIGSAMSKWVQSYNDLPILINQWCNIVRWEMRTRLFLRTSEFLWQEGHTAHSSPEEATTETLTMLDVYEDLVQNYLAIPVIKGEKTPSERFPGAINTYTIEAMMQDGKALQAGTSHFLGQNFSKAYDIQFLDQHQKLTHAWTTSWGVSTRLIGAVIMAHSDDDGLVIPPRIAPEHIILIPITHKDNHDQITQYCEGIKKQLQHVSYHGDSLRVWVDKTDRRGGEKFWDAVKKGFPVRIEIGAREMESGTLAISRRDKPAKEKMTLQNNELLEQINSLLDDIQEQLYLRAATMQKDNTHEITTLAELESLFSRDEEAKNVFAIAHLDLKIESSPYIDEKLKAHKLTTRCIPFDKQNNEGTCIFSGAKTKTKVIFARAY